MIDAPPPSEPAPRPVVIVAGPTASGKSALAVDLARAFDGVVINADSMQVYRDLRAISARPSPKEEAMAPHALYGVLDGAKTCSAARWLEMALAEIRAAWGAGKLPVVAGGTGLYLKVLREGLSPVPEIPGTVRAETRALADRLSPAEFRAALAELDPESAAKLPEGDRQRMARAYEVARATGRTLAGWQRAGAPEPPLQARFATLALVPPRDALYAAIDARFDHMVAAGALDEVRALAARAEAGGWDPNLPVLKAVGVPELRAHLAGELSLAEAIDKAKQASRNYAKRQLTWLRNQTDADLVIAARYGAAERDAALAWVRNFLGETAA